MRLSNRPWCSGARAGAGRLGEEAGLSGVWPGPAGHNSALNPPRSWGVG